MDWPLIYPENARRPALCTSEEWWYRTGIAPTFSDQTPGAGAIFWAPVWVPRPMLVKRIALLNGTVVDGDVDVGLYSGNYSFGINYAAPEHLIVSSGTTAQAGVSAFQSFNVADTWIQAGMYFLAVAFSSATARFLSLCTPASATDETARYAGGCFGSTGSPPPLGASAFFGTTRIIPVLSMTGVA